MSIYGVGSSSPIKTLSTQDTNSKENSVQSFKDFLNNAISKVNNLVVDSDQQAEDFAAGKTDNIHNVLISAEKADIALQFTMQIRNKIMDAYTEIMRMQI